MNDIDKIFEDWDEEEINIEIIFDKYFTNFLIDNNAYNNYITASGFGASSNKSVDKINKVLNNINELNIINHPFVWKFTPQKNDYWSKINKKWVMYICNKNPYNRINNYYKDL